MICRREKGSSRLTAGALKCSSLGWYILRLAEIIAWRYYELTDEYFVFCERITYQSGDSNGGITA